MPSTLRVNGGSKTSKRPLFSIETIRDLHIKTLIAIDEPGALLYIQPQGGMVGARAAAGSNDQTFRAVLSETGSLGQGDAACPRKA